MNQTQKILQIVIMVFLMIPFQQCRQTPKAKNVQSKELDAKSNPFMESIQMLEHLQLPLTFFCGADSSTWANELGDDIERIAPKNSKVVGVLPIAGTDKTYIIYAMVGDILYPYLYVYDKTGRQIDSLYLHIGYCSADDAVIVSNTTTINSDYSISMTDTTKYIHYDDDAGFIDLIRIKKRDMDLNAATGLYTVSNEQQDSIEMNIRF